MERLTDFELEQFEQQLINDGTDTQVRKLIDEVKEYRALAEQIGCPLDVRCKITNGLSIYDNYGQRWIINDIEQECFEVHSAEDSYFLDKLRYKDYKKTWWLKEDRSE